MPRADGPFEILERLNDNAYKVDLPGDYEVSPAFNIAGLSPYLDDNYLEDLRENSPSQGENDGGSSLYSSTSPIKSKGKLMETIFQALEMSMDRAHHGQAMASSTARSTAVHPPTRHLGCTPYKLLARRLAHK